MTKTTTHRWTCDEDWCSEKREQRLDVLPEDWTEIDGRFRCHRCNAGHCPGHVPGARDQWGDSCPRARPFGHASDHACRHDLELIAKGEAMQRALATEEFVIRASGSYPFGGCVLTAPYACQTPCESPICADSYPKQSAAN